MSDSVDVTPDEAPGVKRRRWSRYGSMIGLGLIVLVLAIQWPIYRSMVMNLLDIDPPDDGIEWRTDFAAAAEEASESGKPMLVNFTADWCGPCVAMKRDVWPRDGVRETILSGYVPVRMDVDTAEGQQMGAVFGVAAIPTNLILSPDGEVLARANYLSAGGMEELLAEHAAAETARAAKVSRSDGGDS